MPAFLVNRLWQAFEAKRGYTIATFAGRRLHPEENETFFAGEFFREVLPETRNMLRHLRTVGFLRAPQVDAFELYVYLKEIQGNPTVKELYRRLAGTTSAAAPKEEAHGPEAGFADLDAELRGLRYPNWLFALAMGTGKTILIATMIFYDFILAAHHPEDRRFAKNALIFAPDTTILESLREIRDFDYGKVVPREYALFLATNLKYHYLTDLDTEVSVLPGSLYNVIVSNVQKIILRKAAMAQRLEAREGEWQVNRRLRKLERLDNLAVFVDEAHHAFGRVVARDLKRVRETINRLHRISPLAGCVNLTGTPYVEGRMLPEVVFFYSLRQAIREGYLKQVRFVDYTNTKTEDFIRDVVVRFWREYGEERREGLLPKIAFYCTTIAELEEEFLPVLERVLAEEGIPRTKILINHSRVTEENIRRFRLLDTAASQEQFILLVGKGTEGWNCRSLFATAMYRRPRSRVFLLQSSLRCLRAIGPMPQTATIFLSRENRLVLEEEIRKNLGTTMFALQRWRNRPPSPQERPAATERPLPAAPPLQVVRHYRRDPGRVVLALEAACRKYLRYFSGVATEGELADEDTAGFIVKREETLCRRQYRYTLYTLVEEVSRYTHLPCLEVEALLRQSDVGLDGCLQWVNRENGLVGVIVRTLLETLFSYETKSAAGRHPAELSPIPGAGN